MQPSRVNSRNFAYWSSLKALNASEATGAAGRDQSARSVGSQLLDIDRFELLLQDRAGPVQVGTFVRWNDAYVPVERLEDALTVVRDRAIPVCRGLSGYRATLAFVNRASGRMALGTVWESATEREASDMAMGDFRREVADAVGGIESPRISLWETVFAEVYAPAQVAINPTAGRPT